MKRLIITGAVTFAITLLVFNFLHSAKPTPNAGRPGHTQLPGDGQNAAHGFGDSSAATALEIKDEHSNDPSRDRSWVETMLAMGDQELTIKVNRLEKARAEVREVLDEYVRAQSVLDDAATSGDALPPAEAERASEAAKRLHQQMMNAQQYASQLTGETNDRFLELNHRELKLELERTREILRSPE